MAAQKIRSYFHSAPALQSLVDQAQRLIELQRLWEKLAPQPLAKSCKVGNLRQQMLTLLANNGAVASKAKQQLPSLLAKFQAQGIEITAIRIEVQAQSWRSGAKPAKKIAISSAGQASLEQLAQKLEESPLKNSLQAMLKRQKRDAGQDDVPHRQQRNQNQQQDEGKLEYLPGRLQVAPIPGNQEQGNGQADPDQGKVGKKPKNDQAG